MKWLAILFTLFIFLIILFADLGLLEGPIDVMDSLPFGDKIGHFLLIGMLSFLIISSLIQALPKWDPKRVAIVASLILLFIFTVEEASQGPIRGRDASLADLSANYAGILFFGCIAFMVNKKRR
jgi:VanZ family protein